MLALIIDRMQLSITEYPEKVWGNLIITIQLRLAFGGMIPGMNLASNADGQGKFSLIFIEPVNGFKKPEKGCCTLCNRRRESMPRNIVEFSFVRISGDDAEVYQKYYFSRQPEAV